MNFNINEIINEIPDDMSDIEKIRYIYLKCGELFCFKLEENEIIIDILFNSNSDYYFCAVSLLDKINIYNREMKLISNLKFDMMINPYILYI